MRLVDFCSLSPYSLLADNAISGATFADLELVVGAGDNNTLVHSAVLAQAAPDVLAGEWLCPFDAEALCSRTPDPLSAEIRRAEVLVLDSMEYSANVAPPKSTNGSIKLPAAAARARSHSHAVFPSSDADAHSDPALTPARRFSKVVSAGVRRARTFSVSDVSWLLRWRRCQIGHLHSFCHSPAARFAHRGTNSRTCTRT